MNEKMEVFAAEAAEYGQDMVDFVVRTGLAQMAAEKVAEGGGNKAALVILLTSFNKLANELAKTKGWTQERLADCEHAILLAATKEMPPAIVVADANGRVH